MQNYRYTQYIIPYSGKFSKVQIFLKILEVKLLKFLISYARYVRMYAMRTLHIFCETYGNYENFIPLYGICIMFSYLA